MDNRPNYVFLLLQMIKMMVTVVIIFTACWLPFNVLMVSTGQHTALYSYHCINWKQLTTLSFAVYEWTGDYTFIPSIWFCFSFLSHILPHVFLHFSFPAFVPSSYPSPRFYACLAFLSLFSTYLAFLIYSSFLISVARLIYLSFSLYVSAFPFLKSSLCRIHLFVRFEVVITVYMFDDSQVLLHSN